MPDWLLTAEGAAYLREEYHQKKKSSHAIARQLNTYPNKVRRAMAFHGIPARSRAEAQGEAIRRGRTRHPTKGRERPPGVRAAVSRGVADAWRGASPEERRRRSDRTRRQWEARSDEEKREIQAGAARGLREAAVKGSRLEHHLRLGLATARHEVDFHREFLVAAEKMHVDILLPRLRVAVEVDGPTHFRPVYDDEQLARTQAADLRKDGLLRQAGYKVVRVRQASKNLSAHKMNAALGRLLALLDRPDDLSQLTVLEV